MNERDGTWTLLTGHGHVLVEIARNPTARIRDIAAAVAISERTVQAIVTDLVAAGYLTRTRTGRRTRYTIDTSQPFRHPAQAGHRIGPFLALLAAPGDARPAPPAPQGKPATQVSGRAASFTPATGSPAENPGAASSQVQVTPPCPTSLPGEARQSRGGQAVTG